MDLQIIQEKIHVLRGQRVILDADLANLYGVATKRLKEAVKRNMDRFPEDFMFQLTQEEFDILRSQNVTSSWGGNRYLPFAFTEHGVAMLSGILNSAKAIETNIAIIRAFITLRHLSLGYAELAEKITALEARMDEETAAIQEALRQLAPPEPPADKWKNRPRIGFKRRPDDASG